MSSAGPGWGEFLAYLFFTLIWAIRLSSFAVFDPF